MIRLLAISLLTACATQTVTSATETPEIGVCGANADPQAGVTCAYSFVPPPVYQPPSYVRAEAIEINHLDYAHCTYSTDCNAPGTASSETGASCISVIGTGCPSRYVETPFYIDVLLPPGAVSPLDKYCPAVGHGMWNLQAAACSTLDYATEIDDQQLCCALRGQVDGA